MPALTKPHGGFFPSLNRRGATPFIRTPRSPPSEPPGDQRTWIVLGTVAALLVLLSFAGATALVLLRRRRQRRQVFKQALTRDPHLTRNEFSRWRKMSDLERQEEVERQRAVMIRKSLASRSSQSTGTSQVRPESPGSGGSGSIRSMSSINSAGTFSFSDKMNSSVSALTIEEEAGEEEGVEERRGRERRRSVSTDGGARQSLRLREEYKQWESGIRRQRTLSGEIHPVHIDLVLLTAPPPASPRGWPDRKMASAGPPMPSPTLPLLPRTEELQSLEEAQSKEMSP